MTGLISGEKDRGSDEKDKSSNRTQNAENWQDSGNEQETESSQSWNISPAACNSGPLKSISNCQINITKSATCEFGNAIYRCIIKTLLKEIGFLSKIWLVLHLIFTVHLGNVSGIIPANKLITSIGFNLPSVYQKSILFGKH